jgi:hypothetical protein
MSENTIENIIVSILTGFTLACAAGLAHLWIY